MQDKIQDSTERARTLSFADCVGLSATAVMVGGVAVDTLANNMHFELGYIMDVAPALAIIPVSAAIGGACLGAAGAVLGQAGDFLLGGPQSFNFSDQGFTQTQLKDKAFMLEHDRHFFLKKNFREFGVLGLGFGGAIGAFVSAGVASDIHEKRHGDVHAYNDTKIELVTQQQPVAEFHAADVSVEEMAQATPHAISYLDFLPR